MPPRPSWPRYAEEWDRVQKLRQECLEVLASLSELDLNELVQLEADLLHLLELPEARRAREGA